VRVEPPLTIEAHQARRVIETLAAALKSLPRLRVA
jgi:4-aminobutyrate aminotransferase-like enzyme